MRLRTKMLLVWCGFVLLLGLVALWPVQRTLQSAFARLAAEEFEGVRQNLRALQDERARRMRQASVLVMSIPELRALIAEHNYEIAPANQASLKERLDALANTLDVEFVSVLDNRGNVIAMSKGSPWRGVTDFRRFIVGRPEAKSLVGSIYNVRRQSREVFGLWSTDDRLVQVVGVPLVFGGDDDGPAAANAPPDGAMIIGSPITSAMAKDLASNHGCHLTFFCGEETIAATSVSDLAVLRRLPELLSVRNGEETDLDRKPYRVWSETLNDPCSGVAIGRLLVQSDQTDAYRVRQRLGTTLLWIVCVALVLMAGGSYVLSGAVTRPIDQLIAGANRVAAGDLTHDIPSGRRDEFGRLATAFNDMMRQIAARRELERQVEETRADSRAKSQFLANMSHEIRTPLNGVIGMAELLLGTDLSERQRRYCGLVKSSAEVLTTLVNDALDFAKIEAGKLELESLDFDLYTAVEEVVEMFAPRAFAKGLAIVCDIDGDVRRACRGDRNRLRQVIINLLNNAAKFTEKGCIVVGVCIDPSDASRVKISVSDTGVGIPADRLDRLFKAFSQVDVSTTRKYGGTGLGLAICKQLAELMGGGVGVESQPGAGSTFWFTSRLEPADALKLAPLARPEWRQMKVLVAENDPTQRDVLARRLGEWGLEVTAIESGPNLREALAGSNYRIAVVGGPMDGGDHLLHARTVAGDVPTLVLLRSDREFSRGQLAEAGVRGYVTQPLRLSQLSAAITLALSDAPVGGEVTEPKARVRANRSPRKILLADDHEVNQLVVAGMLEQAGYECTCVGDGRRACEALAGGSFELVLMDCQMPVMDGYEAAREIRRREQTTGGRRVPIIALTANAEGEFRGRCAEAGMDDFCTKPIDREQLLEAIRRHLPVEAGAREVDQANESAAAPVTAGPIDLRAVLRRCNGKVALAEKVLEKLAEQAQAAVTGITQSMAAADAMALARHAHSLKGSAGMAGAAELQAIAGKIEAMGNATDLSMVESELKRLGDEVNRCVAMIADSTARVWPSLGETKSRSKQQI